MKNVDSSVSILGISISDMMVNVVYDLVIAPNTFDFVCFCAHLKDRLDGHLPEQVNLYIRYTGRASGPVEVGYDEGYRYRKVFNVLVSIAAATRIFSNIVVCQQLPNDIRSVYPSSYDLSSEAFRRTFTTSYMSPLIINRYRLTSARRVWKPLFVPQQDLLTHNASSLGRYITVTIRASAHSKERNQPAEFYTSFINRICVDYAEFTVVVVPDLDSQFLIDANADNLRIDSLSSIDLFRRIALYAGAVLNVTFDTGPASILWFMDASWLYFGVWNEASKVSNRAFLERKGPSFGEQFCWTSETQILDWCEATRLTVEYCSERVDSHLDLIRQR